MPQIRGRWLAWGAAHVLALALPATALADYTGTITGQTASLKGSGSVVLTTSGGLVHHNAIGSGFASDTDFDSSAAGVQTVPDTGGWEVDVTGGGSDTLEVDEGEAANPVTYESGHDMYPIGTPASCATPTTTTGSCASRTIPRRRPASVT
jgi:hypothetical protein